MVPQPDASEAITLVRVAEPEIGPDITPQLQALLQMCFPGYPSRSYSAPRLISVTWRWPMGPWWARWASNSG